MNDSGRYCYICTSCGKMFYSSTYLKLYCPDCGETVIRCDVDDCYTHKNIIMAKLV